MTKTIPFSKVRFLFIGLSIVVISALLVGGSFLGGGSFFNLGVEFSPGFDYRISVADENAAVADVRAALEGLESNYDIQEQVSGANRYFVISVKLDDSTAQEISLTQNRLKSDIQSMLSRAFGPLGEGFQELELNLVTPSQVSDLSGQMLWIVAGALILTLLYITIRFKWQYAIGAIAAIAHDILFLLGFIALTRVEFTSATVAALLTIIGYSLNDTIVIFDRIRENRNLHPDKKLAEVTDLSITQSLGRTMITSITTFLAVSAILFLAFGAIQNFALALTVGILVGTYSSIFIANPVMMMFTPKNEVLKKEKKLEEPQLRVVK